LWCCAHRHILADLVAAQGVGGGQADGVDAAA